MKVSKTDLFIYFGGFQKVGGIESFFFDLLVTLSGWSLNRKLAVWGRDLEALRQISVSGTKVVRSALSRGCKFHLPDALLVCICLRQFATAKCILFAKLPAPFLVVLIATMLRRGRRAPLVYITPYRPKEMWPKGMPAVYRRNLDTIIVQSESFAADLRAFGFKGSIEILPLLPPIPEAVPLPEVAGANRDQSFRLGVLGRLVRQKNVSYLFEALNKLNDESLELHIFGDGDERAFLEKLAKQATCKIYFHGSIDRDDLSSAINRCDAFAIPSISEGQCLVALEILSHGRPILASGVGALPDILSSGRFGYSIPIDDPARAGAIIGRLRDEIWSGDWSPRKIVAEYQKAYSRSRILDSYKRILNDAVGRSEPAGIGPMS